MANIIDFEKEIKEAVSKEVYENVFIKSAVKPLASAMGI